MPASLFIRVASPVALTGAHPECLAVPVRSWCSFLGCGQGFEQSDQEDECREAFEALKLPLRPLVGNRTLRYVRAQPENAGR